MKLSLPQKKHGAFLSSPPPPPAPRLILVHFLVGFFESQTQGSGAVFS
jgi:hypothetical protein